MTVMPMTTPLITIMIMMITMKRHEIYLKEKGNKKKDPILQDSS